ncbi:unnamed protein product [Pleuronectes platessa]|uniref:Uncharacterized protein n=1 Tax=Pleuronectes platessa TaxID=8262 RepID=A0A9N7V745_PLEPL|nr:unnamed protein product [Pleuronectes platessa]
MSGARERQALSLLLREEGGRCDGHGLELTSGSTGQTAGKQRPCMLRETCSGQWFPSLDVAQKMSCRSKPGPTEVCWWPADVAGADEKSGHPVNHSNTQRREEDPRQSESNTTQHTHLLSRTVALRRRHLKDMSRDKTQLRTRGFSVKATMKNSVFTSEGKSIQTTPDPNLNFRVAKGLQIAEPIECIYIKHTSFTVCSASGIKMELANSVPKSAPQPASPSLPGPPSSLAHPTNPGGQMETPC